MSSDSASSESKAKLTLVKALVYSCLLVCTRDWFPERPERKNELKQQTAASR
jgi:hypothetical protein